MSVLFFSFFPTDKGAFLHYVTFEEPHGFDGRFYGHNGLCDAQDDGEHRLTFYSSSSPQG